MVGRHVVRHMIPWLFSPLVIGVIVALESLQLTPVPRPFEAIDALVDAEMDGSGTPGVATLKAGWEEEQLDSLDIA